MTAVDPAVATVGPDATVAEAAAELHRRECSALVVVEGDAVVGLLTERDLVRVIVDGADPSTVAVRSRMRTDVVTVPPATDAMEARELMGRHGVRHLPVVDDRRVVVLLE
jgi:CBS domain-containing protein